MSRKPTLSPTKIAAFLACPLKYRWTYADTRGRWFLRSKSYYSFGNTLHAVLQRFHDGLDVGVTSVEDALGAFDENWIDAGYSSSEEMQEAYGEGKEILRRYVETTTNRSTLAKAIAVEKQFKMPFGDDFDLVGRIDRLDEHPDGTLEIVDYKSGRTSVSPEEVHSDLAMGVYQLLVQDKYPSRPVMATIVALKSGASASCSLEPEELAELRQDLHELGRIILSTNWDERPAMAQTLCRTCDFLQLCRQYPEFNLELLGSVDD